MKTEVEVATIALLILIGGYFFLGSEVMNDPIKTVTESLLESGSDEEPVEEDVPEGRVYNIQILDYVYIPYIREIQKGDTVVWTNGDVTQHTITSDEGDMLDSPLLSKGDSYSYTFNEVGTFKYHCNPHNYMKAQVIVK